MVHNNITNRVPSKCIIATSNISYPAPEAHKPYHHIVGVDPKRFSSNAYAISRCCLSFNGNIRRSHTYRSCNMYNAGYVEDYDTRPALLACPTQCSGSAISKTGNYQHFATTA